MGNQWGVSKEEAEAAERERERRLAAARKIKQAKQTKTNRRK